MKMIHSTHSDFHYYRWSVTAAELYCALRVPYYFYVALFMLLLMAFLCSEGYPGTHELTGLVQSIIF